MTHATRLFAAGLLLLAAAPALAQSGDALLRWDECAGKGGADNTVFACDTNAGTSTLVGSIVVPSGYATLLGYVTSIHAQVGFRDSPPCDGPGPCRGPDMPSWWRLDAAGCRAGSLTGSNDFALAPFTTGSGCVDPWSHRNSIGAPLAVTYPVVDSYWGTFLDRSIVDLGFDLVGGTMALAEGVEYYAFRLELDHAAATGDGSCGGCCQPYVALMGTVKLHVDTPGGPGDIFVQPTSYPGYVSWNGTLTAAPACGPTPTRARSWGYIKSLYR
jgi:hypothetical protein